MITHEFDSEYGKVTVEEHRAPFDEALLSKAMHWSLLNLRKGYDENYLDTENPASLGYLIRNNTLSNVYFLFVDGEFKFFSSTRILEDKTFLCLVRTFSSKEFRIKKPWHLSYLLGLQMMYAKNLGFEKVQFTANIDVKEGIYKVITDRYLNNTREANSVKQIALNNMKWFKYEGIKEVNYCQQHVFSAEIKNFSF